MLDYRPDADPRTPGLLTAVRDLIPTTKGYRCAYAATAHTTNSFSPIAGESSPSSVFGTRWLSTPGALVFFGTNKRLRMYEYASGGSFVSVSQVGDYDLTSQSYMYGEDAGGSWDFCAFGDRVIACNKAENPQQRSATDSSDEILFADLTGAPKANTCCVAANFVFLGDCASWSTVSGSPDILAWSGIGDYTEWGVDPTVTQCSFAQFNDTPGPITAVRPFLDGIVVFKADAMYYGRYVGTGTNSPIWDFVRISDRVGCLGHRSVTNIDTHLVFVGKHDIYQFDGTRPYSITDGIYETIRASFVGNISMAVGHDRTNTSVWFSTVGFIYVWNYKTNRWGRMYDAGTTAAVFCQTNTEDARTVTLSTATDGVQSYTVSNDHINLYTLYFSGSAPKNRNTTRSALAFCHSAIFGDPLKLHTLNRVVPIFSRRPATVGNATLIPYTSRTPNDVNAVSGDSTANTSVTMDSSYRFDMHIADNFFQFKLAVAEDHELMDIVPSLISAGAR